MTIIGYVFYGHDNGSFAFVNDRTVTKCPCGQLYLNKWDRVPAALRISKKSLDVSTTYDGIVVVSERFHEIYLENEWIGLEFRRLPSDPGFFQILTSEVFIFDKERRGTRFEDLCSQCGKFRSVAGATPAFLRDPAKIPAKGFSRSDVEFGSGSELNPLVICGVSVGDILKRSKLKGLYLRPIDQH